MHCLFLVHDCYYNVFGIFVFMHVLSYFTFVSVFVSSFSKGGGM